MSKLKAFYFSHDANARNDEAILKLRVKYGWEGYGVYWAIIEKLREATNYKLEFNIKNISFDLHYSEEKLQELFNDCFEWKLLRQKKESFLSERLLRDMERMNERVEILSKSGKIGAEKRWHNKVIINKSMKKKENKETIRPSIEKLVEYFIELKSSALEANKFFDYFESNGWKVGGKATMKNWKASVRNWVRRLPAISSKPKIESVEIPKREEVNEEGLKKIKSLVDGVKIKCV